MQKIKNAIKGRRHNGDNVDEYDNTPGSTTAYGGTSGAATGYGPETVGHHGTAAEGVGHHHHHEGIRDEGLRGDVVGERPIGAGVAEVPVVVTEQERLGHEHGIHEHHHSGHHAGMGAGRVGEEVCGQKTFTEVEDRPVMRERVERIVEHRPVEKQYVVETRPVPDNPCAYVVETRFVGEKEMGVAGAEIVDVKDRVVDVAAPGPTCPANTGGVMDDIIQGTGTGATGMHHHHQGGITGHHTGVTDRV